MLHSVGVHFICRRRRNKAGHYSKRIVFRCTKSFILYSENIRYQDLIEMKLHLNDRIVSAFFLEFVLNVLQYQADHLDDRDDQRAKSQGARVVPGCVMTLSPRLILT